MRLLAAALFALATLTAAPAAAQPKCDKGTAKKPLIYKQLLHLAGPNGPVFPHHDAYVLSSCWDNAKELAGIVDAKGKVLVPAQYEVAIVLSPTSAAVLPAGVGASNRDQSVPWKLYVFGKGEQGPAPYRYFAQTIWENNVYVIGWNSETQSGAVPAYFALADGLDKPVAIRNLGGAGWPEGTTLLDMRDRTLIARATAPDGTPISRILDLRGKPISPIIGGIERWQTLAASGDTAAAKSGLPREYLSVIAKQKTDLIPGGKMYSPVDIDGNPVPLPPSVVGVVPLSFLPEEGPTLFTRHWGLIEERPTGLVVRVGQGPLADVIARFASLPAYSGIQMRHMGAFQIGMLQDAFFVRDPGSALWYPIAPHNLQRQAFEGLPAIAGTSPDDAIRSYRDTHQAFYRKRAIEYAREQEAAKARWAIESEATHQRILAGDFCNWYTGANGIVPAKTINHILANCTIQQGSFFNYARGLGADPALVDKAQTKYWLAAARYAPPIPPAPRDIYATPNWAAWGDAIINSAKTSTDNFIRDSKRRYYSNMEAWNRGKQTWCC